MSEKTFNCLTLDEKILRGIERVWREERMYNGVSLFAVDNSNTLCTVDIKSLNITDPGDLIKFLAYEIETDRIRELIYAVETPKLEEDYANIFGRLSVIYVTPYKSFINTTDIVVGESSPALDKWQGWNEFTGALSTLFKNKPAGVH